MAKFRAIITGDRELTRALNNIGGRKAMAAHNKALRRAAYVILAWAKNIVPVRSGRWKRSLIVRAAKRSRKGPRFLVTERFTINRASKSREHLFYVPMVELGYRATGRPRALSNLDDVNARKENPFKRKKFNKMFRETLNEDSGIAKYGPGYEAPFYSRARENLNKRVLTYRKSAFLVAQLRNAKKIPGRWLMRRAGIVKEDEAFAIYYSDIRSFIESEAGK